MDEARRTATLSRIGQVLSRRPFRLALGALACALVLGGSAFRTGEPNLTSLGSMDIARPNLAEVTSADPSADRGLYYTAYQVAKGDTASEIADRFDVSLDTVISFNDIQAARALKPGQILKIPSMAGILYTAKEGDSPASLALSNKISADRIIEANGLMSETLEPGRTYFLPDAHLASFRLREIAGDLFRWPVRGWITSWYGYRSDPFSGTRGFHNGLDIGVDSGTPVLAAMEGVVAETGYSAMSGNYILIAHHSGWSSFYGHLYSIGVKAGQRVAAGARIAFSGNTGYTTGPHLHFSVFKNGRSVNPSNVLH
ncbi:MAG TPA: M23 family metallopeptidase [Rectinemataceae bacterium]|nr:M23 family metallopeptidase [Rectinemataceae bacterium]